MQASSPGRLLLIVKNAMASAGKPKRLYDRQVTRREKLAEEFAEKRAEGPLRAGAESALPGALAGASPQ
jgi:hypothetical protein